MLNKSFSKTIESVFQKHGIEDEKLELVLTDLFDSYQDHLLSIGNNFVEKVTEHQDRNRTINEKFR